MKKKSLLGILAILMVIALALTGCGQQGKQNAGATGSENQNSTIANNGNASNGKATAEPEDSRNVGDEASNHNPKMKDGYYVYEVLGEEFLCETNVWDYIDEDAKTFDFGGMKKSLGLGARDGNYIVGNRALSTPYLTAGDVSEACFLTYVCTDETCTKVDQQVEYTIKYSADSSASREYALKGDSRYGFTFDLIVLTTYGCEHLKDDITDLPLGEHLQQYYHVQYQERTPAYELP